MSPCLLIAQPSLRTATHQQAALIKFITRLACIFTQSIQLSNIVLGVDLINACAALSGYEHLILTLCKSEASRLLNVQNQPFAR
jgi:hypothetical protein